MRDAAAIGELMIVSFLSKALGKPVSSSQTRPGGGAKLQNPHANTDKLRRSKRNRVQRLYIKEVRRASGA